MATNITQGALGKLQHDGVCRRHPEYERHLIQNMGECLIYYFSNIMRHEGGFDVIPPAAFHQPSRISRHVKLRNLMKSPDITFLF